MILWKHKHFSIKGTCSLDRVLQQARQIDNLKVILVTIKPLKNYIRRRLIEDMNLKVDCTFLSALRSKYDTNLLL